MAVTQALAMTRHPYADGSYKKMLIDGKWVDAASGKRFESRNHATGELLATVAEGDAEDINTAGGWARRSAALAATGCACSACCAITRARPPRCMAKP